MEATPGKKFAVKISGIHPRANENNMKKWFAKFLKCDQKDLDKKVKLERNRYGKSKQIVWFASEEEKEIVILLKLHLKVSGDC